MSAEGTVIQLGMRVPLHVIGLDRVKRFVDFAVAGPPTSPVTRFSQQVRPDKGAHKHKTPKPKPAAKAGPPKHAKHGAKKTQRRKRR